MIADINAVRDVIDRMTPDLRGDMPTDATTYGNRLFSMYLAGISAFLVQDDMPWEQLCDPVLRHQVSQGLRSDALRVYYGLPDPGAS